MTDATDGLQLRVGRNEAGYVVQLEGRGTLRESPALSIFVRDILDREPSSLVVLELSDCTYLDSTFLGCIVALHKRYAQLPPARFLIWAPADVRDLLLAPTRLDRVLTAAANPPVRPQEWLTLPIAQLNTDEFGQHVARCHLELAELDGPDAAAFRRIVAARSGRRTSAALELTSWSFRLTAP